MNIPLDKFERTVYSQNGEDGVIEEIFKRIGVTNKFFVEFGVQDGKECNTKYIQEELGWKGLLMDCDRQVDHNIKNEFITAENVNKLFKKYSVPNNFDLLSIDIDYNDYWVWRAISGFYPRVVIIEYNASEGSEKSTVVEYDPEFRGSRKSDYFGASLMAMKKLGEEKGYKLVYCDKNGVNAFFVRNGENMGKFEDLGIEDIYRRPNYGSHGKGHPRSNKKMLEI